MIIERKLTSKLLQYINESLNRLYKEDSYLIHHVATTKAGEHVSERSIVFRFGIYLAQKLSEDADFNKYSLDCEYNRSQENIKSLPENYIGSCDKCRNVVPDMILHKRGSNKVGSNIMVIEFKGYWNNQDGDADKIKLFTTEKWQYRYQVGYTICFMKKLNQVQIKEFKNGEQT